MKRRDYLKALAALPVAARVSFNARTAHLGQPIVDLRDRRAENDQELVILMTPPDPHRGYADFDPRERAKQAQRLAKMLALNDRAETYIEWHHDHEDYRTRFRREFGMGRIEPRTLVAATLAPRSHIDIRLFAMADAWVEMTSHDAGDIRVIEFNPFDDAVVAKNAGSVEF